MAWNGIKPDDIFYIITIVGMIGAIIEYIVTSKIEENKINKNSRISIAIFIVYIIYVLVTWSICNQLLDRSTLNELVLWAINILILLSILFLFLKIDKIKMSSLSVEEKQRGIWVIQISSAICGILMGGNSRLIMLIDESVQSKILTIGIIGVEHLMIIICLRLLYGKIINAAKPTEIIGLIDKLPIAIQPYCTDSLSKGKVILGNVCMEECGLLYIRLLDGEEIKLKSDYVTYIETCSIKRSIKSVRESIVVIEDMFTGRGDEAVEEHREIYIRILIDKVEMLLRVIASGNTEDRLKKGITYEEIRIELQEFMKHFKQGVMQKERTEENLKFSIKHLSRIEQNFFV